MNTLIEFALRQRVLVILLLLGVFAGGFVAFQNLNIEAYPDPVPPMVDIVTQSDGMSAEEVERYITIPIETQTSGLPNLRTMRTISLYGLSDVKLQFTFDYTYEQALQQVLNRLSQLPNLPNGAQPSISPVSPIGEIYRYKLTGPPGYSVLDLKTLQDWVLQRRFRAIPGVIDVTGWGGKTKTYEVQVKFDKLVAYGLTLPQVIQAINNANINVGGNTVDIGSQSAVIRGVGAIRTVDDIRNTMLTQNGGSAVLVKDIADVIVSNQPRLGIAGKDDDNDIVQGIVLMRRGEKSMPTILNVHAAVERINSSGVLPPGVKIERIYDRKELIDLTTHTVLHNMMVGIILVFLIQWLFLGDLRSAVIVAATIPFSLCVAIGIMVLRGESANLLSVGAIDFGLIVDATVIIVENIFRNLAHRTGGVPTGPFGKNAKLNIIYNSSTSVSRSILFSGAIIIAAFLPLFTLSGVEAHIFGPMAKTYAYALAGGLLATFIVSPALSAVLLPERVRETETWLVRGLDSIYRPVLRAAMANRLKTVASALILFVGALAAGRGLGLEFLPKLEEGNLWIRATMPATISLTEGNGYVNQIRSVIQSIPEVQSVVSQHGRPDDGTDATGFFNAEFFAPLVPAGDWRPGMTKDKLTAEILGQLERRFPGIEFNFSQYLQDNVAEAVSGVKGENSIKLYGNDLAQLTATGNKIKDVLATVPGIKDLSVFTSLGQPTIQIDVDRERASRYGLAPGDINTAVHAAIGGQSAGDLFENGSDRHFPIMVRLAPEFRQSAEAIRNLTIGVAGQNGSISQIPLSDVASIRLVTGASYIYREQQERYLPIKFSVRDRDLGGAIEEAQRRIAEEVKLGPGMRLEWVGEFGNLQDAIARLKIVVPVTLLLIALLLYLNFASITDTLLALSVIPMAMVGGVVTLFLSGTAFSVSAAMGFIALFGISVMEGVILLATFNGLINTGMERSAAIFEAATTRMRPVMMTCVAACVGLFPAAISTGIGSQVQKPLAMVVVGGILLAPILILVYLPLLIDFFSRRKLAIIDDSEGEAPVPEAHPHQT
ncbi:MULTISPECIES: CusA/CzcA family heavy metal efflux RND transporter [unclassified Beijerinckia]|uniref:efflux RND transporter permease subunit n=1 Tax=unclassified Beijerinckia TaxID=2638183 RepID=UPI000899B66B|nr:MULTISPECIES: CusA/CzcA family heavy metal efflux RND transporter [unclassified Beijerinckia]MDH7794969.1 cobalt-zinc-cadmium resistance protein CzcA [Beijerinckia sp. GAS462]SEB82329.1 cobalt-zinc-cadmium resistance protein CzcA [Beijerinckia sp. 28-YEA-48]